MNDITISLQAPYEAQQKIIDNRKRNNLLVLSRRWGKTTLSGTIVVKDALLKDSFRQAWSAPTWKLMLETFEQHRNTLYPVTKRVNREDRRIELINGSVIEYWSSDDPSAGRGRKYHRWVADEMQRQKNFSAFVKGSLRPCLADYRGELWILGTANGEGSDFHEYYLQALADKKNWQVAHGTLDQNPYIHPEEIASMRIDLGPELAAQELDSKWIRISGVTPLVLQSQWLQLYQEKENNTRPRVLALDCSVNGDTTAIIGVWRDDTDGHFYTDYNDIHYFEPSEETDGEIDFSEVENTLWKLWITGKYSAVVYDPYQAVSLIQRLKKRGVRTQQFNQGSRRLQSDSFLRQCLMDKTYHHPDHFLLTDHMLNSVMKFTNDDHIRIIKPDKTRKIDLAVALSMALYHLSQNYVLNGVRYEPLVSKRFESEQAPVSRVVPPKFLL